MGVQLVTGKTGMPVSSKQDGALYAAIVGKDKYVTSIGSKCLASMQDANTLVVQDGYCLTNGRVVEYKGTTNFTIPSGTQGQKRAHLCGHRVTIDEEGNEKSEAIVLSGEPTSDGEPVDPTYNDGSLLDGATTVDHMLYRVVTDGINALDPVALFTPISTADEFRDSISLLTASSESASIAENTAGQLTVNFDVPDGCTIKSVKEWRTSQITMLGVDGITFSGNKATVVVRNYGARRNASVTVTVEIAKV